MFSQLEEQGKRFLLDNKYWIVFGELEEQNKGYLLDNQTSIVFGQLEEQGKRYLLDNQSRIVFSELEEQINNEPFIFYVVTIICWSMQMNRTVTWNIPENSVFRTYL